MLFFRKKHLVAALRAPPSNYVTCNNRATLVLTCFIVIKEQNALDFHFRSTRILLLVEVQKYYLIQVTGYTPS